MVSAFGRLDSAADVFLFWFASGVLQGCPLAGSFFVIAKDAVFSLFVDTIDHHGQGVVWGCADDIGAALADICLLRPVFSFFHAADILAGLALNTCKVVIVPLLPQDNAHLVGFVRRWLRDNLPEWSDFRVDLAGKYLGAFLGPQGGSRNWETSVLKWHSRAMTIAAAGASASVTANLYNIRAVTTLSYLAQVSLLPAEVEAEELGVVAKLLRIPHNSLSRKKCVQHLEMGVGQAHHPLYPWQHSCDESCALDSALVGCYAGHAAT